MKRLHLILSSFYFVVGAVALADESNDDGIRFFETKIRPLFANNCYECHGAKEQESGLRLDSGEAILQGGESGPAIVPGEPDQSLIVTAIRYDTDLEMPPEKKLSDRQIKDIIHWVKIGAPFPKSKPIKKTATRFDVETARQFWSFRPPVKSPAPDVHNKSWPRQTVDQFVLAQLDQKQISPAPPADRRTLIRRVTFDLIGLPPAPDEVAAFLADKSPDAYSKLIERLLASPRYGERWGRHWLDVARYADSNGLDENIAHGNAWRYRDYVVAAFNGDKPYDQFVVEQLAGDLLDADDTATKHERLIATGFLSLGPKVLAEVDERKMQMDIVDEQIDTVGRALMGLTLGCARCHDHKFDPFRTMDYYALAGIFKSTRTMEHFKKIARWWENSIATPEDLARKKQHEQLVAEHKEWIEAAVKSATKKLKASAEPGAKLPKNPESQFPQETKDTLKKLRDELAALEKNAPVIPTAMGVTEGEIADTEVHVRGSHLTLGATSRRRFPVALAGENQTPFDNSHSGRLRLAKWLVGPDNPLTSRVMANRIWHWHFGQGLLATPDNFGHLGERPINQPLLDWLAVRFVDEGWSIKQIHRMVLTSSTYQMSSDHNARAASIDPENRLQWRANVRRLEAEAIRDFLLSASGMLDTSMGGSLLHVDNRKFIFDHTSKDETNYDSRKRSIYLPVVRNNLYDVFSLFDYSDASTINGTRPSSTVAPQALFMMNSELVRQAADQMADNLLKESPDDRLRAQHLYLIAYARQPSETETSSSIEFVSRISSMCQEQGRLAQRQAWSSLCHMVLASNEFLYAR